jgi:hypothetical protein
MVNTDVSIMVLYIKLYSLCYAGSSMPDKRGDGKRDRERVARE